MSFNNSELEQAVADVKLVALAMPAGGARLERFCDSLDLPLAQVLVVDRHQDDDIRARCDRRGVGYLRVAGSFAAAANTGIDRALKLGARHVGLAFADIVCNGPVLRPLLTSLLTEPRIGAVAPVRVLKHTGEDFVCYRRLWNLTEGDLLEDENAPDRHVPLLEADFCDFTYVLLPADDLRRLLPLCEFELDEFTMAELGYRLFAQGLRATVCQRAQIVRALDATPQPPEADILNRDRARFARMHLRHGVSTCALVGEGANSWEITAHLLSRYETRYGLADADRPRLELSHPGLVDSPYLYTVWETTGLPADWHDYLPFYEQIFVTSQWVGDVLKAAGYTRLNLLRLGFEPDQYSPFGPTHDWGPRCFLSVCHNQHRKGLDVLVAAWQQARARMPDARLILFGYAIDVSRWLGPPARSTWFGKLNEIHYPEAGITVLRPIATLSFAEMAQLYRSAHALVLSSRSEGFGMTVVEAMACGTPWIVPNYAATADFTGDFPELAFSGQACPADYGDKGFGSVGNWWEPERDELAACLLRAYALSDEERAAIGRRGRERALTEYTWRETMRALRDILRRVQEPRQRDWFDAEVVAAKSRLPNRVKLGRRIRQLGQIVEDEGLWQVLRRSAGFGGRLLQRCLRRAG